MSEFKKLKQWNLIMGVLHLIQASILFILIFLDDQIFDVTIVTRMFGENPSSPFGYGIVQTEIFDVPIVFGSALFLLMSAIAHFFIISPLWYDKYQEGLRKGINAARWWEYGFSSSVMIIIIGLLGAIVELSAIVFLFTLNFLMNMMGWLMEKHNQTTEKTDWTAFNIGIIAGLVPWVVIAYYFFGAIANVTDAIPDWAILAFFVLFFFYNTFAINMFLQYRKVGPWKDYLFGEKMYVVLSLVSKSTLAWIVYLGITFF